MAFCFGERVQLDHVMAIHMLYRSCLLIYLIQCFTLKFHHFALWQTLDRILTMTFEPALTDPDYKTDYTTGARKGTIFFLNNCVYCFNDGQTVPPGSRLAATYSQEHSFCRRPKSHS